VHRNIRVRCEPFKQQSRACAMLPAKVDDPVAMQLCVELSSRQPRLDDERLSALQVLQPLTNEDAN